MRKKRNTPFSLPSYRDFKKDFGRYNALISFENLACKHLLAEKKEGESIGKMLSRVSELYGGNLTDILPEYQAVIDKSFLNHPFACFEAYLEDFREEYKKYVNPHFSLVNGEGKSKLEQYLLSLKVDGIIPQISICQTDLYHYHRLIRNSCIHHDSEYTSLRNKYKQVQKRLDELVELYDIKPSSPEQFSFNDYVLCSTNINAIAELISIAVEKHINWEAIDFFEKGIVSRGRLRRLKDKKDRQIQYIHSSFISVFGIKAPTIAVNRILSAL